MRRLSKQILAVAVLNVLGVSLCVAQQQPPPLASPPPDREQQETVTIFTEEVSLPVVAYDDAGKRDQNVGPEDFLVQEGSAPQPVKSVRRSPASVVLLLDMYSEVISGTDLTREVARKVLAHLHAADEVAIVQASDRAEMSLGWTNDKGRADHVLRTKLFPGRRPTLVRGVEVANELLKGRPSGNNHVVIVTGGVEAADGAGLSQGVRRLADAQATVHVISYSAMILRALEKGAESSRPKIRLGMVKNPVVDRPAVGVTISVNMDREMQRWYRNKLGDTKENERRLAELGGEIGRPVVLPSSAEEALGQADQTGREIEAQYVLTYTPRRPFAQSGRAERRSVTVLARRGGLHAYALRDFVIVKARKRRFESPERVTTEPRSPITASAGRAVSLSLIWAR